MKLLIIKILALFLLAVGCDSKQKSTAAKEKNRKYMDSLHSELDYSLDLQRQSAKKALKKDLSKSKDSIIIDTSTLAGKRKYISDQLRATLYPLGGGYSFDTLFDVNYDQSKDFILAYYGPAGTGLKHRVEVYVYSSQKNNYIFDEQLSSLFNPTFYIDEKKITSFYIAHGGGEGKQLEWVNQKWQITKEFFVRNQGEQSIWEINYPLIHKKETLIHPYQPFPPKSILISQYNIN